MISIPHRPIGRTGLTVPELGFGAAALGNLYTSVTDFEARSALDAALDAGMCYVDTAPHYGRGLSERRVGDAIRGRSDAVVSTKVGRVLVPDDSITDDRERDGFRSAMPFSARYDYSFYGIMLSFEHSRHRMGLSKLDLLYVHDIGEYTHGGDANEYWRQLTDGGGLRALERLREDGEIRGFGIGVNETAVCLEVMRQTRLDAILLAGRYTLLEQDGLDALFPACEEAGTSIVIGGPYNSGILATGTKAGGKIHFDYGDAPDAVLARVRAIEAVAERHDVRLPAAALAFVLAHPLVASVIPGIGSAARVAETLELYREPIPNAFWDDLRSDGLLRADAPVPARELGA